MTGVSNFIIGTILVSLMAVVFVTFLGGLGIQYGVVVDNQLFEPYNKLTNLSADSESIKDATLTVDTEPGILDVIGGYFRSGFRAVRVAFGSFNVFVSMLTYGFSQLGLSDVFKIALVTIAIIFFFLKGGVGIITGRQV